MRLIDADALLDDLRSYSASYFTGDFVRERVDKQPTVDAVPVRYGHYIMGENNECYCSECKRIDDKYSVTRYCWFCGAWMQGVENRL